MFNSLQPNTRPSTSQLAICIDGLCVQSSLDVLPLWTRAHSFQGLYGQPVNDLDLSPGREGEEKGGEAWGQRGGGEQRQDGLKDETGRKDFHKRTTQFIAVIQGIYLFI